MRISLLEIYNENIVDLLSATPADEQQCDIREDPKTKENYVSNLTERPVTVIEDVVKCLADGDENRHVRIAHPHRRCIYIQLLRILFFHSIYTHYHITLYNFIYVYNHIIYIINTQILLFSLTIYIYVCVCVYIYKYQVASTKMNSASSRSHLILTIIIEGKNNISGVVSKGRLTLVDLAGSERISKTEATGQRLVEAAAINKSLSALGR